MPRLPTAKNAIRVSANCGFLFSRQKGSHAIYKHADGRRVTIPIHAGKELGPALFRQILKDLGISRSEFWKLC